ncbi:Zn-dependent protease with chaperone function [Microbacteriaceae bacterium SG_E_30_P1]|uniref:Zn-dependent protease with chaperone function n=1 Tax=Antiquaquibacter oligotrophicus TaxID=2880260 RepID=A0ABT6KQG8_9MICO|nr:M56 family metallopeptidase [Antiquaquibacter oligotrophicus]MDH6182035.1 Zn-dependent protease with chaperone function [Antiquaquibacter oligotrophicus]UDF12297.1 M56 family metallopeptidase [Antiquaquibacter oligotrophicus]
MTGALVAPALLAALALALAWPVPLLLAGARWTRRSPATALVLWQAIAVAGGLSMIGALLTFGLLPFGDNLLAGALALPGVLLGEAPLRPLEFWNVLALAGAALLTGHLLLNLLVTVVRAERQRRRHAGLLMLLSQPHDSGTRLIDTPAPVAYCLPGAISSVTVVSAGLIELLDEQQMLAVIEHERAHVKQRHDIVLVFFRAWRASLPWFPIAYRAQEEVGLLIELLADDEARRVVDDEVLADAIVRVGAGASVTSIDDEATPTDALTTRLARLAEPPLPRPAETAVLALAAALVLVPPALLFVAPLVASLRG